jgi:hypothetical protein
MRERPELGDCAIVVCSVLDRADLDGVEADAVLTKPFGRASVEAAVNKVRRGT